MTGYKSTRSTAIKNRWVALDKDNYSALRKFYKNIRAMSKAGTFRRKNFSPKKEDKAENNSGKKKD